MLSLPLIFSRRLISAVAVGMSLFHLYVAFVGPPDAYVFVVVVRTIYREVI